MDTTELLKKEINQTVKSLHDFAKWKLIVTAALAASALGLTPSAKPVYWLFLFAPYACGYIDLNCYQYLIRITVISRFIRESKSGDTTLKAYEAYCEALRIKHNVFDLGLFAQIWVSIIISISPIFAVLDFWKQPDHTDFWLAVAAWIVGVLLVIYLWFHYKRKNKLADGRGTRGHTKAAEAKAGAV